MHGCWWSGVVLRIRLIEINLDGDFICGPIWIGLLWGARQLLDRLSAPLLIGLSTLYGMRPNNPEVGADHMFIGFPRMAQPGTHMPWCVQALLFCGQLPVMYLFSKLAGGGPALAATFSFVGSSAILAHRIS